MLAGERYVEDVEEVVYSAEMKDADINAKFEAVNKEIDALHSHSSTASRRNWLIRNGYWLWPILPVAIAIIAYISGGLTWVFNKAVDGQVDARSEKFETRLTESLNAKLRPLDSLPALSKQVDQLAGEMKAIHELWAEQLKRQARLSPNAFEKSLPQVAQAMQLAKVLDVHIDDRDLRKLQVNMAAVSTNAPEYWSALSQFISFRSEQRATPELRSLMQNPKRCFGSPPILVQGDRRFYWKNCFIDLDDVPPNTELVPVLTLLARGELVGFENCVVGYRGGPVLELLAKSIYIKCLFAFSFESAPPPRGQQISKSLLASTPNKVVFPDPG